MDSKPCQEDLYQVVAVKWEQEGCYFQLPICWSFNSHVKHRRGLWVVPDTSSRRSMWVYQICH